MSAERGNQADAPARRTGTIVDFQLNLEQLRKQAKERVRARRTAGGKAKLADVQFELARELGFPSWPKLKAYAERLSLEQPFRAELDYYEGRAHGIASVTGLSAAEARCDLAARHGFSTWRELRRHVEAMQSGKEPPTPFVLAYQAVEVGDRERLAQLIDRFPDLVIQRGRTATTCSGWPTTWKSWRSCWSGAPTPTVEMTAAGRSSTRRATRTTATSPG